MIALMRMGFGVGLGHDLGHLQSFRSGADGLLIDDLLDATVQIQGVPPIVIFLCNELADVQEPEQVFSALQTQTAELQHALEHVCDDCTPPEDGSDVEVWMKAPDEPFQLPGEGAAAHGSTSASHPQAEGFRAIRAQQQRTDVGDKDLEELGQLFGHGEVPAAAICCLLPAQSEHAVAFCIPHDTVLVDARDHLPPLSSDPIHHDGHQCRLHFASFCEASVWVQIGCIAWRWATQVFVGIRFIDLVIIFIVAVIFKSVGVILCFIKIDPLFIPFLNPFNNFNVINGMMLDGKYS